MIEVDLFWAFAIGAFIAAYAQAELPRRDLMAPGG